VIGGGGHYVIWGPLPPYLYVIWGFSASMRKWGGGREGGDKTGLSIVFTTPGPWKGGVGESRPPLGA
jgi:hypothetical protein